jgi:DNA polymerase III alpha subunit
MIPLHVHSNYSLLQGTISINKLIEFCKNNSIRSVALTDTNAMNGLIQFSQKAYEASIQPILGTCLTEPDNDKKYIICIAKNNEGYSDICRIITQRKLNDDFSLFKILKTEWKNLIIITPHIELLEIINQKNSFYAEIIPTISNKKNALKLYEYSKQNNISIVASNPVYFLDKKDFELHKLVTAIRLNKTIASIPDEELVDEEFYFKTSDGMEHQFKKIPKAIANTHIIAEECKVDLNLGEYKYPSYNTNQKASSFTSLSTIAFNGLRKRYDYIDEKIKNRLEYELSVINELNFTDYFLIVWDIVQEAKKRGMMTIGRGSAANSLVAYCLELTQVDPIKLNLYFERFLNKARSNPPDVDIDFSWKERDEIVKYVFERYGYERVAMISTTITFRARSAFRETAKAFGISNREISKYSKKIPWTNAVNLPKISDMFPESKSLGFDKEPWKTIVQLASKIANFPRHLSIHPSGIVITPTKITDYCALEYANNKGLGLIITQPDMYSIEDLGLVKIDLLSQRSLGVLRDTMDNLNKRSED